MGRKPQSFLGQLPGNPLHFIEDSAGANDGLPSFRGSFALTHSDFSRLLGKWFIRKNADPDATPSFDMAGHRDTAAQRDAVGEAQADEVMMTLFIDALKLVPCDPSFLDLRDAATDSVLRRATGNDQETLTPGFWDVQDLQGRTAYIYIEDSAFDAYINVDEIHETDEVVTAAPAGAENVATIRCPAGKYPQLSPGIVSSSGR